MDVDMDCFMEDEVESSEPVRDPDLDDNWTISSIIPLKYRKIFGRFPLNEEVDVVRCKNCGNVILESVMPDHFARCHSEISRRYEPKISPLETPVAIDGVRFMPPASDFMQRIPKIKRLSLSDDDEDEDELDEDFSTFVLPPPPRTRSRSRKVNDGFSPPDPPSSKRRKSRNTPKKSSRKRSGKKGQLKKKKSTKSTSRRKKKKPAKKPRRSNSRKKKSNSKQPMNSMTFHINVGNRKRKRTNSVKLPNLKRRRTKPPPPPSKVPVLALPYWFLPVTQSSGGVIRPHTPKSGPKQPPHPSGGIKPDVKPGAPSAPFQFGYPPFVISPFGSSSRGKAAGGKGPDGSKVKQPAPPLASGKGSLFFIQHPRHFQSVAAAAAAASGGGGGDKKPLIRPLAPSAPVKVGGPISNKSKPGGNGVTPATWKTPPPRAGAPGFAIRKSDMLHPSVLKPQKGNGGNGAKVNGGGNGSVKKQPPMYPPPYVMSPYYVVNPLQYVVRGKAGGGVGKPSQVLQPKKPSRNPKQPQQPRQRKVSPNSSHGNGGVRNGGNGGNKVKKNGNGNKKKPPQHAKINPGFHLYQTPFPISPRLKPGVPAVQQRRVIHPGTKPSVRRGPPQPKRAPPPQQRMKGSVKGRKGGNEPVRHPQRPKPPPRPAPKTYKPPVAGRAKQGGPSTRAGPGQAGPTPPPSRTPAFFGTKPPNGKVKGNGVKTIVPPRPPQPRAPPRKVIPSNLARGHISALGQFGAFGPGKTNDPATQAYYSLVSNTILQIHQQSGKDGNESSLDPKILETAMARASEITGIPNPMLAAQARASPAPSRSVPIAPPRRPGVPGVRAPSVTSNQSSTPSPPPPPPPPKVKRNGGDNNVHKVRKSKSPTNNIPIVTPPPPRVQKPRKQQKKRPPPPKRVRANTEEEQTKIALEILAAGQKQRSQRGDNTPTKVEPAKINLSTIERYQKYLKQIKSGINPSKKAP